MYLFPTSRALRWLTRARLIAGCVLALTGGVLHAAAVSITSGHAGHWYAADRSGEGWVLELRGADSAWLYWFTYDEAGGQRWLTATGQVVADGDDGQRIDFPQLVVTRGARFGAAFDPDDVIREVAGSARLRFSSCDNGQFSYEAFGQSQTFDVQRLARVMGSRCETPHGVTGREVAAYAGQSGSWYDPSHNGEGYALHWSTPDQAIVTWYSYDPEGNQYWMLGVGHRDDEGRIHFPDVHATRGARFGAAFDPDDVERFAWGELSVDLSCDAGGASYASVLPSFGDGSFELTRLTSLHEVACPWQRPTLADLYDIEVFESPHRDRPDIAGVQMGTLIDGGRLFGVDAGTRRLLSWRPGESVIRLEQGPLPSNINLLAPLVFSNDGAVRLFLPVATEHPAPIRWTQAGGWSPLSGFSSNIRAPQVGEISSDGDHIVGYQGGPVGGQPWAWDGTHGFTFLPLLNGQDAEAISGSRWRALYVSDGGRAVTGQALVPGPFLAYVGAHSVRWDGQGEPVLLRDRDGERLGIAAAASNDGRVVFGLGRDRAQFGVEPLAGDPWYWTVDGRQAYLGVELDGESGSPWNFCPPYDTSADGSVMVGMCAAMGMGLFQPFVWTSHTGMVSLPVPGEDAGLTRYTKMRISSDGRDILLVNELTGSSLQSWRSRVVRLEPRTLPTER